MESLVTRRAAATERISALIALVLGVLALVGSTSASSRLGQWLTDLPNTSFLTAATICLLSLAHLARPTWNRVAAGLTVLALALDLSALVVRIGSLDHPLADWWQHHVVGRGGHATVPSYTTAIGLFGWAAALLLVTVGLPRVAQVVAAVPAVIGGLAVLSFVYGDRLSIIRTTSFPNTATSAPAAYAFLFGALAVLAATPEVGVSAWITVDSTGRRVVRSLVPIVVLLPLVLAGLARWTHLARSVGEARAWALVMSGITIGIFIIAAFAVHFIDNLASASQSAEVTEVRLGAALRAAAVADLAQALAASMTAEEVASSVNSGVCTALGANLASFGIIDPVARVLRMQHGHAVDPAAAERFDHPSLDDDLVISQAARTGESVFVTDYDDYRRRFPGSDAGADAFGTGARAGIPLHDRSGETFGALVVSWDHSVEFEDSLRAILATVGPLVAQSLERARVTDDLAESAARNAHLAELSEALAVAAEAADVVRIMCERVAAPIGAIEAIIGVIEDGGERLVCSLGVDGGYHPEVLREPMESDRPVVVAARTGKVLLLPDRDTMAREHPAGLDRFDMVGLGAAACVPLRNRAGELFGAFGVGWDHPVTFDPPLVRLLSTIAELSAQTLQRAWLADERGRDVERARRLAAFSEALAVATTSAGVAGVVYAHVPDIFDAELAELILDVDEPVDPLIWPGSRSATIPVMTAGHERQLAWLCIRWSGGMPTDDTATATLLTITELVSQTIDRAYLAEAEHRLVDDLQRRTLHPIPSLAGFDIAARYEPAAAELGMGGDWFEVVELDDDRIGLIVGDVVGHGVDAAAEMTQISGVLATLLPVGTPLESLFARVHEAVRITSPRFLATAAVAVVDRGSGRLRYVSAGHPPSLIATADGVVTSLDGGRQPVIGMPPSVIVPGEADLAPGSTLITYTDGLIERRGEDLADGMARLRSIVAGAAGQPAATQVGIVVDACTEGRVIEDDIALVALRREPG